MRKNGAKRRTRLLLEEVKPDFDEVLEAELALVDDILLLFQEHVFLLRGDPRAERNRHLVLNILLLGGIRHGLSESQRRILPRRKLLNILGLLELEGVPYHHVGEEKEAVRILWRRVAKGS